MKMASSPSPGPTSPFRTAEQRVLDRQEKREALLRAAVRMFNARGFHATSLDDVAASLGISKPTIYHYLGNKEQVLLECVSCGLDMLHEAGVAVLEKPGTGLERLRYFLCLYVEITMDDFGRCLVRTGPEMLSPHAAKTFIARKRGIDDVLRTLIQQGVDDGSLAPVDIRLAAFTVAGALNWPARWYDPAGPISAEDIAQAMVDILTHGLASRA